MDGNKSNSLKICEKHTHINCDVHGEFWFATWQNRELKITLWDIFFERGWKFLISKDLHWKSKWTAGCEESQHTRLPKHTYVLKNAQTDSGFCCANRFFHFLCANRFSIIGHFRIQGEWERGGGGEKGSEGPKNQPLTPPCGGGGNRSLKNQTLALLTYETLRRPAWAPAPAAGWGRRDGTPSPSRTAACEPRRCSFRHRIKLFYKSHCTTSGTSHSIHQNFWRSK